jgi:hypothetical protein
MKVKLPYKTDQIYDNHRMSLTRQANFHLETVAVLDEFVVNFSPRSANLADKLRGLAAQLCGDLLNVIGNKDVVDAALEGDSGSDHISRNKFIDSLRCLQLSAMWSKR